MRYVGLHVRGRDPGDDRLIRPEPDARLPAEGQPVAVLALHLRACRGAPVGGGPGVVEQAGWAHRLLPGLPVGRRPLVEGEMPRRLHRPFPFGALSRWATISS